MSERKPKLSICRLQCIREKCELRSISLSWVVLNRHQQRSLHSERRNRTELYTQASRRSSYLFKRHSPPDRVVMSIIYQPDIETRVTGSPSANRVIDRVADGDPVYDPSVDFHVSCISHLTVEDTEIGCSLVYEFTTLRWSRIICLCVQ